MKKTNYIILSLYVTLFSINLSFAQGQFFNNKDATKLFGKVTNSSSIKSSELLTYAEKDSRIWFSMDNANLSIGTETGVLLKGSTSVNWEGFNSEVIKKLLNDGQSDITTIEYRDSGKITLTNGAITIEMGMPCPPYCGEVKQTLRVN